MSETFSMRLKKIRDSKGWTQQQFADKIGCSRATYNHYENGNRHPDDSILRSICQVTHISADYLLGLSDTGNPSYNSAAELTGFSEKALDYLKIKKDIANEAGIGIENTILDFIICDANQKDIFEHYNPNPYEIQMKTQCGKKITPLNQPYHECKIHILDAIKYDWNDAKKDAVYRFASESDIYFDREKDDYQDFLRKRKYEEELKKYFAEVKNNSHFLDNIVHYLFYDKYKVLLCSSVGHKDLDDNHSLILKLGNTAIQFPSEESSKLIEDMLIQNVIDSLKKLKENYKKEYTE